MVGEQRWVERACDVATCTLLDWEGTIFFSFLFVFVEKRGCDINFCLDTLVPGLSKGIKGERLAFCHLWGEFFRGPRRYTLLDNPDKKLDRSHRCVSLQRVCDCRCGPLAIQYS